MTTTTTLRATAREAVIAEINETKEKTSVPPSVLPAVRVAAARARPAWKAFRTNEAYNGNDALAISQARAFSWQAHLLDQQRAYETAQK